MTKKTKAKAAKRKPKAHKMLNHPSISAEVHPDLDAAYISGQMLGAMEARRLAKWLNQFADWHDARKGSK